MSRIFSGVLQMSIAAAWMIPVCNGAQTLAETGTEVGESCAVGACGTAAGVPFCAGEPVQSEAEAARYCRAICTEI